MTVAPAHFKISTSEQNTSESVSRLRKAVILLARNQARSVLAALSPTALTDSSGGVNAGPLAAVVTAPKFNYGGGATYAPRAGFNTAIATVDNAIAVLKDYLNTNVFTPLASPDSIAGGSGTPTDNTVAAITETLTGVDGAADAATNSITLTTAAPADGDTVTINGKVYTFQTSLTNTDGHVLIGASLTAAATNLFNAINLGTNGGTYAAATTLHPTVSATNPSAGVVDLTAKTGGTAGNALTLARTFATGANCTLGGATFSGGNQDSTMLRSDFNAAITAARNNLATIVKAYNECVNYVGAATVMDNTGGVPDVVGIGAEAAATFTLVNQPTAGTTVTTANTASSDVVALTDANNALTALANNIAFIAHSITNVLLASGTLTNKQNVLVVQ